MSTRRHARPLTQKRQTPMPPVGFETANPASERPQTHALYRAVTWIGYSRDRGFESRWGHESSSLVSVVCCVGTDLCNELITLSEGSYWVCVSNCVWFRNLKREEA
jgi:hypothetical protein